MARKKAKKNPFTVTVKRVGEVGAVARPAKKVSKGYRGPSRAMQRMTGAVSSARKAATRAGQMAKAEPTRIAVGTLAGSVAGKIGADMLHDRAVKNPIGTVGKNEAMTNAAAGGIAAAAGVGVALMGGQTTVKRYVVQTLSHVASFMAGSANAINNAQKKPVPVVPVPPVAGMEDDPFRSDGGDTGAPRRQRAQKRRQMIASRMASQLRAEDPTTSGVEGPELEEYCAGVLDDAVEDVSGLRDILMAENVEETGFPLAAGIMAKIVKKIMGLLKKEQAQKPKDEPTMTDTVLELEGMTPEEIETGRKPAVLKELRRERRALKKDVRREKRADRKAKRQDRRAAKREWKEEKPLTTRQERKVTRQERRIDNLEAQRPVIIRTVPATEPETDPGQGYEDNEDYVIIVPSDEEIEMVSEGRL